MMKNEIINHNRNFTVVPNEFKKMNSSGAILIHEFGINHIILERRLLSFVRRISCGG
jgi:hypothetical protein